MTTRVVTLRWPLAVIPAQRAIEQLGGQPNRLVDELTALSARGVLPARLEPERDDPSRHKLVVYASRHAASLYLTQQSDGYRLGHVSPRTFRDEDRLTTAALLLHCPSGWRAFGHVRDLPRGAFDQPWSSQIAELRQAWDALLAGARGPGAAGQQGQGLPAHHRHYLDLVERVIEASRDIEIARQELAPPLPYARREAAREQRYSGRGVYVFHLARAGGVTANALVQIADQPELRGRVDRVDGREVVVRFDQSVDFRALPPQGELRVLPSDLVYSKQRAAVETLANGESANPALLPVLVDGAFAPFQPDGEAEPRRTLDDNQRDAFRRALTVPDLLLVLGPPGTGKTTTITEIVLACAARGETVLVTSHTNRAVDNVLANLSPDDVHAVRVGSESSMTAAARARTVDSLMEEVRAGILADTAQIDLLTAFGQAEPVLRQWLDHLADRRAVAADAQARHEEIGRALDDALATLSPELASARRRAEADHDRCRARLDGLDELIVALRTAEPGRQTAADAAGPLGWWRRWRLGRLRGRLSRTFAERAAVETDLARVAATRESLRAQAAALAAADPHCGPLVAEKDELTATIAECHRDTAHAASVITGALRPMLAVPEGIAPDPEDGPAWERFLAWASQAVTTVRARGALLAEWRSRIGDAETELRHELVRYAQVVATTCVGTASSPLLTDIVFDVAIIDEAGQISTPNMLVPMVRARRSILVGDHHQLPPFLDEEVKRWSQELTRGAGADVLTPADAREIGDLLVASGFERLFPRARDAQRVELTLQRRMPEVLARFVSNAFYQGRLRTSHEGGGGDPIFRSPFGMIDTSDRPADERAERALRATEPWQQRGYVNELEAELIAGFVACAAGYYGNWAVIVPYLAQAARIEAALTRELGDPGRVTENIGTVDSFQGGERDLIVYGFTRSNRTGSVGFLSELRRLNVAITRAKQQLVLVGDTSTLCSAGDESFAALARSLVDYLRANGDLRGSAEVGRLLREYR